jgi:hypothetical protein
LPANRRDKRKYRHSRESGNRCPAAAKPRKLGGFAAKVKRFPLIKGMTVFFFSNGVFLFSRRCLACEWIDFFCRNGGNFYPA